VSVSTCGLRRVDRGALVGHLSNKAVDMVGSVGGGLDTAVRESDHEGSLDNTIGILGLSLLEVSLGVVVIDSVLIGEGLGGKLLGRDVCRRGAIGGGGTSCEGSGDKGRGKDGLE
jgi:hypothetical protein